MGLIHTLYKGFLNESKRDKPQVIRYYKLAPALFNDARREWLKVWKFFNIHKNETIKVRFTLIFIEEIEHIWLFVI